MSRRFFCLIFSFFLLFGCSSQDQSNHAKSYQKWMTPSGKIKVLSTIAMIHDLVQQVGGEHIDTTVLIQGELDPHSYQLVKGDDEKLAIADLIFYNGLGLEHGPSLQSYLLKYPKAIPLGNKLMKEFPSYLLTYKEQVDPHIWMDIALWAKTVPYIVDALSQKDPIHAEAYKENGRKLIESLSAAHERVKNYLQAILPAKRYLVTSHDAFNYFARTYLAQDEESDADWRKRFMAPEGLAPESQISATDIQNIISHLKQYHIHVIFPESNINRDSIRKIVSAAKEQLFDVKIADTVLYADAMGKPGSDGDSYIKMLEHNAKTMSLFFNQNGR